MKTLSAKGITKTYDARRVVDNVDLEINKGEVTGLLGPNGAGKTTIFYMMVGLIRPDTGKVFLDNDDITDQPMYIRARKGINYLPQESSIFRKLTVEQNILAILETLKLSKGERKEKLRNLLDELNIKYIAKNKAYTLSGGERRRVEIARSLVTSPSFILLDEPFAGIDPIAVIDIQGIIMQLKSKGIGVIISDHNVRETLGVCDKAYIIDQGTIIEIGDSKQIANSKKAREIYLGENFKL
ncbi:MAG: LPS export ABC transporter ATP-binding protein [Thermodesulfobacteriota bacterium]|nr:LPS export ABC transporter ATP-binding protein [Thermodesulfobacteriota bacterium]